MSPSFMPYMLFEESDVDPRELLDHVLAHQHEFAPSGLSLTGLNQAQSLNYDFRRSLSLHGALAEVWGMRIEKYIRQRFHEIQERMGISEFCWGKLHCSIVAFGEGSFLKRHSDLTLAPLLYRKLSFVYYFHAEPKAFEGGELVLDLVSETVKIIPKNGLLVIFRPACKHEVLPVHVLDDTFINSRFTVTGFIHEKPNYFDYMAHFAMISVNFIRGTFLFSALKTVLPRSIRNLVHRRLYLKDGDVWG